MLIEYYTMRTYVSDSVPDPYVSPRGEFLGNCLERKVGVFCHDTCLKEVRVNFGGMWNIFSINTSSHCKAGWAC